MSDGCATVRVNACAVPNTRARPDSRAIVRRFFTIPPLFCRTFRHAHERFASFRESSVLPIETTTVHGPIAVHPTVARVTRDATPVVACRNGPRTSPRCPRAHADPPPGSRSPDAVGRLRADHHR